MNKRVTRTLIILLVILAVAIYIRRYTNVPEESEESEVSVKVRSESDTQSISQRVLPDDEIPIKINGHDGEPIQDESPEQRVEVGIQPVRYTRDLGV